MLNSSTRESQVPLKGSKQRNAMLSNTANGMKVGVGRNDDKRAS